MRCKLQTVKLGAGSQSDERLTGLWLVNHGHKAFYVFRLGKFDVISLDLQPGRAGQAGAGGIGKHIADVFGKHSGKPLPGRAGCDDYGIF
jgi:hypothetical protein